MMSAAMLLGLGLLGIHWLACSIAMAWNFSLQGWLRYLDAAGFIASVGDCL
jgi:hypothetical protein